MAFAAAARIPSPCAKDRPIPRFFFHTIDGGPHQDTEGTELPSTAAARVAAVRYGGALLADDPDLLWDGHELRVQVADETGRLVVTVVMLAIDGNRAETGQG